MPPLPENDLARLSIHRFKQAAAEQLYIDGPWWAYVSPLLWLFLPYQLLVALGMWALSNAVDPNLKQNQAQCIAFYTDCQ
jgi:hypothetical protein